MPLETSKGAMQSVGNYDLVEKIAEGGMGAIYRGRHRLTGEVVAIKIMSGHVSNNPVLVKRFEQEFKAASRLDHPNIVRALDYGESAGAPFLVMEFVEGESLGQKIEREGAMAENDAIKIIAQVAQGLHRAHKQGLVHRDVKPDNILVRKDGVAKLADLGLVKETEADLNLTKTGRGLGTPHFMAPEQFRNAKGADVRCDIYSLGATLYQLVTGELPFKSNGPLDAWMKKINNELVAPNELAPKLSDRCNWAIQRAMSPDALHRPASCREFIEDLTGHSTRRVPGATSSATSAAQDLWYLVYKDDTGQVHTVKGSTSAIRKSLKEGYLGDAANVRASRVKTGPFEPIREHPEFRDLLVTAAPLALAVTAPTVPAAAAPAPRKVPTPTSTGAVPHIAMDLDGSSSTLSSVGGWLFLLLVTAVSAVAAYYFLPRGWFPF